MNPLRQPAHPHVTGEPLGPRSVELLTRREHRQHATRLGEQPHTLPLVPIPELVLVDQHEAQGWRVRGDERLDHLFETRCDWYQRYGRAGQLAVDSDELSLTYDELDARANQLARYLRLRGASAGDRIGLLFDRPADSYIAMLAVLKIGAAYVPLNVSFPTDRLAYIIEDARVRMVLSASGVAQRVEQIELLTVRGTELVCLDLAARLIDEQNSRRLIDAERGILDDQLAYIIYTSGSNGRLRGVAVDHPSICNFVKVAAEVYGLRAQDRVYQGLSIAFDFSVEEIWVPWSCGATLVPRPSGGSLLGADLHAFLSERRVTAMCSVPTVLATIEDDLPDLRFLLVAGDSCPRELITRWHRPGRRFLNVYGPSEATVTATWTELHPDKPATIGIPLPTYSTVILDVEDPSHALPHGEIGEIGIAGIGLACGYLNRDDLTDEAFIPDFLGIPSNPSGRIYRTGDLGRVNIDGEIEYHGRIDRQGNVRGYRNELAEIESMLLQVPEMVQPMAEISDLAEPSATQGRYADPTTGTEKNLAEVLADIGRLTDLASPNSTFVNGHRITETAVTERDLVGIGHNLLQLVNGTLVKYLDTGDVAMEADDLTVIKDGRTLVDGASFSLPGRSSLLAVIGPSGAGKSTLLRALTGFSPADAGRVRYDGQDLYANFDELRQRIGSVPQDDILHPQLTVRRALSYAARLRFPTEVSDHDREERIDEVLVELGLQDRAELRISKLSGGQRKRTSVALELLTKPSLLFLDEPTSGLDPGLDKQVMHNLRDLADDGRTVVVVTHSVANLELCDRLLILAPGGQVAYFGPPAEALAYFDQPDFAEVFLLLEHEANTDWAARFRQSPFYYRNVEASRAPQRVEASRAPQRVSPKTASPGPAPRQQSPLSQFSILCRRYFAVIAADRPYLASLAVLPVLLSLLARAMPGGGGLSTAAGGQQPPQLLLVLVMGGILMGSSAAVRELVKERAIYRRERATGLSLAAYLSSKVAVLGLLTGIQAALFTTLALVGVAGPDQPLVVASGTIEIMLAIIGVTWAATALGLLISAVIDNADRGMPLLVLLIMCQLMLCGGLFPMKGRAVLEQLSWLVPARWGYAIGSATLDLGRAPTTLSSAAPLTTGDPLWNHNATTWAVDMGILAGLTLAMIVVSGLLLRRLDPSRGRST
ncbi:hypothetical protein GCM10009609_37460 [Pseudonocardia aurantiaca]|uniref:Amino acid adenylation domain-containing protein n=1 Tax=Pseudonocardia aurantiaca TaxID=75290 RepID=A0ABW4FNU7_9PSEU